MLSQRNANKQTLRYCPFCGSKDITLYEDDFGTYTVACMDCTASIEYASTPVRARELWNERAADWMAEEWLDD